MTTFKLRSVPGPHYQALTRLPFRVAKAECRLLPLALIAFSSFYKNPAIFQHGADAANITTTRRDRMNGVWRTNQASETNSLRLAIRRYRIFVDGTIATGAPASSDEKVEVIFQRPFNVLVYTLRSCKLKVRAR